jgi:CRP/FNR family cyclic AMP-dependent transcriptional regulator
VTAPRSEARSATAVAIGDVEATVSSGATRTRALEDAAAARGLIRILASRLRDADRTRIQFATLDTLGRVAERLLELSERFGHDTGDGITVEPDGGFGATAGRPGRHSRPWR